MNKVTNPKIIKKLFLVILLVINLKILVASSDIWFHFVIQNRKSHLRKIYVFFKVFV